MSSEIQRIISYRIVFVYRIAKKNYQALLSLQQKLRGIYKKHGMLGSQIYQLNNKSNVFEGVRQLCENFRHNS